MIRSAEIRNYRCFEHLNIPDVRRFNVIVGDNGAGKTTLIEALFLALGSSPELSVRFRQQRGLEGALAGSPRVIEEALWRDLFYNRDWQHPISIETKGDGVEARSVTISRGPRQVFMPLTSNEGAAQESISAPLTFTWRDHTGQEHPAFPKVSSTGIQLEGTNEDLPDFFYFAANQTISSVENAGRFSELSRSGGVRQFVEVFAKEYKWIDDLAIEVVAGAPVIFATLDGGTRKLPLANVSGGVNRIVSIMLALASHPKGVALVDEMENGVYYKHHAALWRSTLAFARQYDSQLIVTTHNEEWLHGLVEAAGDNVADIALWRLERKKDRPVLRQFNGEQVVAGIEAGGIR